jgi:hypothetical protein
MRCLADREVRQRRAFHEIAGGHIGCVGGGRCRRLLRGGRGAPGPLFPLLSRIRFRRGRLASFRVTAARCASGRSRQAPARPCSRRRPGLGTALARYSAARFSFAGRWSPGCWSHRRSSCVGQTTWRSCSRKATRLGAARQRAPGLLPARVLTVVLIPWPVGA